MAVAISDTHVGGHPLLMWVGRLMYKERKGTNLRERGRLVKVKLVEDLGKGNCRIKPEGHKHTEDVKTRWLRPNWADNPDLERPNLRPPQQSRENEEMSTYYIVDVQYQRVLANIAKRERGWSRDYESDSKVPYETKDSAQRGLKIMIGWGRPIIAQFKNPDASIDIVDEHQFNNLVSEWETNPCKETPDVPQSTKSHSIPTASDDRITTGAYVVVEDQWGRVLCRPTANSLKKCWKHPEHAGTLIASWPTEQKAQSMITRIKSNDELNSDNRLEIEQVRVIPFEQVDKWARDSALAKTGRSENELVVDLNDIDPEAIEIYLLTIKDIKQLEDENIGIDESIRSFRRQHSKKLEQIKSKKKELADFSRQSREKKTVAA